MKKSIKRSLKIIAVVVLAVIAINYFDIDDKHYDEYLSQTVSSEQRANAIQLNDYERVAGPVKLAEAGDQVSGVTWSPITESLYVVARGDVVNVLEYDRLGNFKRRLKSNRNMDAEGITWVDGNTFIIVNERQQELSAVQISPETRVVDFNGVPTFSLAGGNAGNKGLEGIAWNPYDQSAYVVKEKDPIQIFRIQGFLERDHNRELTVTEQKVMVQSLNYFNRDLSGIHFDSVSRHFVVLSDESHALSELDENGQAVSVMNLEKGWHGLKKTIKQPEGVAMDTEGTVFIVGEPNDLYIFKKVLLEH
ncbi:MAG: SdiA-regulated domain-containing protein [Endozoicomonas sp.]|uniref:SdiA-regulated domain-containing protein n=1 Tax=Endozoicomonas sp. TaxID=1892382 RepID=UPI003D9B9D33